MAMLRARHMKSCVLMWDGWLEEGKQDRSSLTLNHWLCPLLCSSPLAEQQRVFSLLRFGSDQRWRGLAHSRSFNCNQLRMPRTFSPDENISSAVRDEKQRSDFQPHCMFVTSLRGGGMKTKAHSTECKQDAIHFLHACVQLLLYSFFL